MTSKPADGRSVRALVGPTIGRYRAANFTKVKNLIVVSGRWVLP